MLGSSVFYQKDMTVRIIDKSQRYARAQTEL